MKFFWGKSKKRNRQEERIVNCSEIFVAKTTICSSFLDPHGGGPLTLEKYFLVTEKDGKYFELFSGVELKKNLIFIQMDLLLDLKTLHILKISHH